MISLRFVGDVPLWMGLTLAVVVSLMSWRYYRRESLDLSGRLRWSLPLLRSLAFFLGIMVLTGPVLHHRKIIGELGRVTIYVDSSRSMTMHDRHMSVGRKLLIAEQLGWLNAGHVDSSWLNLADQLADARQQFLQSIGMFAATSTAIASTGGNDSPVAKTAQPEQPSAEADVFAVALNIDTVGGALQVLRRHLTDLQQEYSGQPQGPFPDEILSTVDAAVEAVAAGESREIAARCQMVSSACFAMESSVRRQFEQSVVDMLDAGDKAAQSALAMFDETPRWNRLQQALQTSSAQVIDRLRQQHDVRILNLAGEPMDGPGDLPNARVTGLSPAETEPLFLSTTDLSTGISATQTAVTEAVSQNSSTPDKKLQTIPESQAAQSRNEAELAAEATRAAVVLLTDGQHNSGPSPIQTARILGSQGIRFLSFAIGANQQAVDLAVLRVEYPETVFRKDVLRGVVVMQDRVPAGRPFIVQISSTDQVLWQEQLVTLDVGERRIDFELSVDDLVEKLGAQFSADMQWQALPLQLQASIVSLPEETETGNNQLTMRLAAIVQSYRILLLDGRSRWESRYLRNVFERDEQWSINTIIAGPGTDHVVLPRGTADGQFPLTRDQLFEYDVVIYGELPAELLSDNERQWLKEFVEFRGGGIVFIDGQRGALRQLVPRDVSAGSLAELLPVEWLSQGSGVRPVALQLTEKGAAQPALSLQADVEANRQFWNELPPPHSIVLVKPLPDVEVLVQAVIDDAPQQSWPAIVTRSYGAGRVLYLAFDESWRWRYKVADTWHQRIWNQLVRSVMPRPFAVSDDYVAIDTGPVSYSFGQSVDVRIRLNGLDGKPATEVATDALVWKDGRVVSTIGLMADPDVPGVYRGRSAPMIEGSYEVSVQAAGFAQSALKARSSFVVLPAESGEMVKTSVNHELLQQMAIASGGTSLREEQISQLPDLLSPLSSGRVVESDTMIWESYWWFAAILLLLTAEWLLRKRAGLL